MHRLYMFLLLFSLTFLVSCIPPKKIIEDLGIVTAIGFDLDEDEKELIRGTTVIYQFNPQETNTSQIITSEGLTVREVRNQANKKSMHYVVPGHLNVIIFGQQIAEKGIGPYLDALARNAEIPNTYHITMSLQPANELLNASNYEDAANVGVYLNRLLMNAVDNEIIIGSRQFEFFKLFFESGQDPTIPLLHINNDKVEIAGIALLQDDRYVGYVDVTDAFYMRLLKEQFEAGELTVQLPTEPFESYLSSYAKDHLDHFNLSIHQIESDSTIKLIDQDALTFKAEVDFKGKLLELSMPLELEDSDVISQIEREIEKILEEKLIEIITMTKEKNTDPFGFGKLYDSTVRGKELTTEEWRELYPNIEIDFDFNVKITRYGTVD